MKAFVLFENLERLEKKLASISRKCSAYGCSFFYRRTGKEEFKTIFDNGKEQILARFVEVEAEGSAVVNGWEFIAVIEHTTFGNVIRSISENVSFPEKYRNVSPNCEHCNINRYRKDTYLVRNIETGEFKQVGKSCLKDYTNGLSAELVTEYISGFDSIIKGETPYTGIKPQRYYETQKILEIASELIRVLGYEKKNPDNPMKRYTALRAEEYYRYLVENHYSVSTKREIESNGFIFENSETKEIATNALHWIRETAEIKNDFMKNLKTLCMAEGVTARDLGIVCSLIPTYTRNLQWEQEKKKKEQAQAGSVHVGTLKERIAVEVASFSCVTSWFTQFGTTYIFQIVDTKGNIYTWKTSNVIPEGTTKIVGTVKAHNEYRGIMQTELTRCKCS